MRPPLQERYDMGVGPRGVIRAQSFQGIDGQQIRGICSDFKYRRGRRRRRRRRLRRTCGLFYSRPISFVRAPGRARMHVRQRLCECCESHCCIGTPTRSKR